jgi:hypothetical protein
MTTTRLTIEIEIEVTGTFVKGNIGARDEEQHGDTFDNLDITAIIVGKDDTKSPHQDLWDDLLNTHRPAIIEALLTEHSNNDPR